MFWAAIEIISPLFQKSTSDMSQPKHHKKGQVSLHICVFLSAPTSTPAPAPSPASTPATALAPAPAPTPMYLKRVMKHKKMKETDKKKI